MKKDNLTLLKEFESIMGRKTNYPNNKTIDKKFERLEKEIAKRLGITENELKTMWDE